MIRGDLLENIGPQIRSWHCALLINQQTNIFFSFMLLCDLTKLWHSECQPDEWNLEFTGILFDPKNISVQERINRRGDLEKRISDHFLFSMFSHYTMGTMPSSSRDQQLVTMSVLWRYRGIRDVLDVEWMTQLTVVVSSNVMTPGFLSSWSKSFWE